jgi:transcriptional regulator with XRE-family HTH domain
MSHSTEYPATVSGVKRGLRALGLTQSEAAERIGKSPAMVSMVLAKKAKSDPLLKMLAALIQRELEHQRRLVQQAS